MGTTPRLRATHTNNRVAAAKKEHHPFVERWSSWATTVEGTSNKVLCGDTKTNKFPTQYFCGFPQRCSRNSSPARLRPRLRPQDRIPIRNETIVTTTVVFVILIPARPRAQYLVRVMYDERLGSRLGIPTVPQTTRRKESTRRV